MLLTGYADKENAIKAINEAVRMTIENGLERRFLMQRLEEKIREVEGVRQNLQEIQAQIIKAFI